MGDIGCTPSPFHHSSYFEGNYIYPVNLLKEETKEKSYIETVNESSSKKEQSLEDDNELNFKLSEKSLNFVSSALIHNKTYSLGKCGLSEYLSLTNVNKMNINYLKTLFCLFKYTMNPIKKYLILLNIQFILKDNLDKIFDHQGIKKIIKGMSRVIKFKGKENSFDKEEYVQIKKSLFILASNIINKLINIYPAKSFESCMNLIVELQFDKELSNDNKHISSKIVRHICADHIKFLVENNNEISPQNKKIASYIAFIALASLLINCSFSDNNVPTLSPSPEDIFFDTSNFEEICSILKIFEKAWYIVIRYISKEKKYDPLYEENIKVFSLGNKFKYL